MIPPRHHRPVFTYTHCFSYAQYLFLRTYYLFNFWRVHARWFNVGTSRRRTEGKRSFLLGVFVFGPSLSPSVHRRFEVSTTSGGSSHWAECFSFNKCPYMYVFSGWMGLATLVEQKTSSVHRCRRRRFYSSSFAFVFRLLWFISDRSRSSFSFRLLFCWNSVRRLDCHRWSGRFFGRLSLFRAFVWRQFLAIC